MKNKNDNFLENQTLFFANLVCSHELTQIFEHISSCSLNSYGLEKSLRQIQPNSLGTLTKTRRKRKEM
jgi:hypothetical protein